MKKKKERESKRRVKKRKALPSEKMLFKMKRGRGRRQEKLCDGVKSGGK